MIKETMTVHKALCELKILDSKIPKMIKNLTCVGNKRRSSTQVNGTPVEDFSDTLVSYYQSILDTVTRRTAIKKAVVVSNATTTVTIMGNTYTVAEVIELLKTSTDFCNSISAKMSTTYNYVTTLIEQENRNVETKADAHVVSLYQNGDKKNVSDEAKKAREDYISAQAMVIVDPLDVKKRLEALSNFEDAFRIEADSALSTSNAITMVDVEYETVKI